MKKKCLLFLLFIVCTALFSIIGLYVGGYIFIKRTHMDISILSYDTLFNYYHLYQSNIGVIKEIKIGAFCSVLVSLLPSLIGIMALIAGQKKEELHGSARWANDLEIKKSGLIDD